MTSVPVGSIDRCPADLALAIREFWPVEEWDNAAAVAELESDWDPFALNDSTRSDAPCGSLLYSVGPVGVTAERSVGHFQLNACNFPTWEWQRFYNVRHNAGTAHMLWTARAWTPWFFSARTLGLL